uniref:Putative glycosyltransferase n=1 Tax=viral metagenome TaxID=1070528 RepID=A0A6M3XDP8_9ZZZZ
MNRRCVVTRADDNIKNMIDITHPIIKRYAKKCDADFHILDNNVKYHPHYRILQIKDMFDEYDRILVLDSDILILNKCPDIFDLVPFDCVATIYEDKLSRQEDRRNRIRKIQEQREDIGWKEGYINSGVILFSKVHKDIFDNIDTSNLWMDLGYDDVEIGYQTNKLKHKVHELDYRWNFMSMFLGTISRADAYIIHYAGQGMTQFSDRIQQIKQDYILFRRYGLLI